MRKILFAALSAAVASSAVAQNDDPYLWLEEIEGAKALEQVKAWNAATEADLTKMPGFEERRQRALAILNDPNQIAAPSAVMGDLVANHWVDANHKRGLWRVSPLADYLAGKPQWRTLIDVDALGKAEGKSWVWHGADCLPPEYQRCLVSLSPGGSDADVVREFDLTTGKFVEGGFVVPESKNSVTWVDRNTLMVAMAEGEGTVTKSGYARIVKEWKRGTPWSAATKIAEVTVDDIGISPVAVMDGDVRRVGFSRNVGFYESRRAMRAPDGRWVDLPIPETANFNGVISGQAIATLVEPLGAFQPGSVVAYDLQQMLAGQKPAPKLVMAPTKSQAIEEVSASDNVLWIKALDDVSGKLFALRRQSDGSWSSKAMPLPANSTVHIAGTADKQDIAFATVEGMLNPTTLMSIDAAGKVATVQSLPAQFDASKFTVDQRFATSKDGTRVPYFLVRKKGVTKPTGVLVHAYGGFRAAQTPTYLTAQPYRSGPLGLFWAEDGGAFVLANIRGGGEYGPGWWRDALREKRQNSFDDLEAVSRDLIATGVARKDGVAISGRSNGGVLVGAALTQHPDLYSAVISGSPLHDMKRYSHMLAGASWIDEYGDPDKPADWAFMSQYSPYQNVRPGVRYPATFFYLSTKDDRVHPGHARKMAAKLSAGGSTTYYHEYLEGGHSVGADRSEDAMRSALLWAFLTKEIGK
ncbi:prolyl oligopeptidase family serine peptidase [Sphingomonas sp. NSE70-1]|uniref:Prolyl oligopeptidase family serine peptidase n=1 Tax=Sphingomonas caseinilyticus TaxID=2908205 RepID=A0ABT0RXT7_9SPHN|nr:prolyl oligopeptidase family serine peptidase [Sphingomonas caseinilyticus]MCL6699711.1 prolyl oligopeptidase family serine peptidase [Sphingomonas caseinilyticus]